VKFLFWALFFPVVYIYIGNIVMSITITNGGFVGELADVCLQVGFGLN